jgi:hypothetical protein
MIAVSNRFKRMILENIDQHAPTFKKNQTKEYRI